MNEFVDLSERELVKVLLERDVLRADVERLTRLLAKAERTACRPGPLLSPLWLPFRAGAKAGPSERLERASRPPRAPRLPAPIFVKY